MSSVEMDTTLLNARRALLQVRNASGVWEGELSSSALSTATAMVALHLVDAEGNRNLIQRGTVWLVENQNEDGGWGDTVLSFSNISTTLLCWSALKRVSSGVPSVARAEAWVKSSVGSLDPDKIVKAVTARYGKDRTFAVPILMLCAICGNLGSDNSGWRRVLPLPFELAVFPRKLFAVLRLPVVSYALPALIAIGYARFHHAPPSGPFSIVRKRAWPRASALLRQIQPPSGGFLEATPLTGFVTMALASCGELSHPVVQKGVAFLRASIRGDGSWPIDTNLATWCTTLATKALSASHGPAKEAGDGLGLPPKDQEKISEWLLGQQYRERHPYTDAAPGGWAWTDLSGGVPDADDTAGALLALHTLRCPFAASVEAGLRWLLDLQNGDGGIPTFCKGWGAFPFDRSSPDITAHGLRAFATWREACGRQLQQRIDKSITRALRYLKRQQSSDGSWLPLWFGNQHGRGENNRVYGTAVILLALEALELRFPVAAELMLKGRDWLLAQQNEDGGWGGERGSPSSLEETGLALEALASSAELGILKRGARFITLKTTGGRHFQASPIGFYFAKLWYFETLYPLVWVVGGLGRVSTRLTRGDAE